MPRPVRIQYPGAFYHVTSRGNERRDIFKSTADHQKFVGYLESATSRYGAVIHAYCLLDNHYHLLLETPFANLPEIMRHINGAYTTYFNLKRKRVGHLFQGRYRAILVEADAYAAELSRYIHLNPVRAGIVKEPGNYPWSSYTAYVGDQEPAGWLKTDFILNLLTQDRLLAPKRYRAFVESLVDLPYESPLKGVVASSVLGRERFVQDIVEKYGREEGNAIRRSSSIEDIIQLTRLELAGQDKLARKIAIYLCHRLSGARLREIGSRFALKESAVVQASRRFEARLSEDKDLAARVSALEKALSEGAPPRGKRESGDSGDGRGEGKTEGLAQRISGVLESFPQVRFCTLFGSAARGRMTERSDVDIAVAGEQPLGVEDRARLAIDLSAALGLEVDLVDLQSVSGVILEQALCTGRIVKNIDHDLYARLLKRLWFNQADMMPYVRRILEQRSRRWLQ